MNVNDLITSLGTNVDEENTIGDPAQTSDDNVDPSSTQLNNSTNTTDNTTDPPENTADDADDLSQITKANSAFAQMRVENKKLQETIKGIAETLGLNVKDLNNEAVVKDIQGALIKAQAAQQKVPEELLQRLHTLEQAEQSSKKDRLEQEALLGLQTLKNKFNATTNDLKQFVDDLIEEGKNPFEQSLDLVAEYKVKKFDALIEQAVQKALLEERQRAAKAGAHSSQPGTDKGATKGEPTKVNTISDLEKFLNGN